ncbi:hypothetical protein EST38_g13959 [Candolleomyces aberdarensis]|uniref:Uncharacterized protein n=1 Tax=Candolleomyces aberdarensis TaxID=2316362 RepID=A0A4Q2D0F1_9AGAR|nr:hypothetical protein EST38_g13959 [Candolleomyces aberdarensis]
MDPGLDTLYSQTLSRSQHFRHFEDIISTIVLSRRPLSVVEIAYLHHIRNYEVVHVLTPLQAVIQVPGDDHTEVTFHHKSLSDFLLTEERSKSLFVSPAHHLRLAYLIFAATEWKPPREWTHGLVMSMWEPHWTAFLNSIGGEEGDIQQLCFQLQLLEIPDSPLQAFLATAFISTILYLGKGEAFKAPLYLLTEFPRHLALGVKKCSALDVPSWSWLESSIVAPPGPKTSYHLADGVLRTLKANVQYALTTINSKVNNSLRLLELLCNDVQFLL